MGRTTSGGGRQARLTLSFSRGRWESFSSAMSLLEPERETAVKAGRRRLFFSPTPKDGRLGLPAGHTTGFPAGMHENVFGLDGDVLLRPFVHGEVVLPQHHLVCAGSPGKEIPPPWLSEAFRGVCSDRVWIPFRQEGSSLEKRA